MSAEETGAIVADASALPARTEVPSWRLVLTLTVAGALSALLLSFVYELTLPAIKANKARVLHDAIREVLKGAERVVSFRVTPDGLEVEEETRFEVDPRRTDRVFLGYDADGKVVGFALAGGAYGYGSDPIRLVFGYDPKTHEVLGLKILEDKETPGLGTKIETDTAFTSQFWAAEASGSGRPPRRTPLDPVRPGEGDPDDSYQVDTISGATISSLTVIRIVNDVASEVGPLLEAWRPGEGR